MKKRLVCGVLCSLSVLILTPATRSEEAAVETPPGTNSVQAPVSAGGELAPAGEAGSFASLLSYLEGKTQLGLRLTRFTLDEPEKGSWDENHVFHDGFLGSINRMEETQETTPFPS